MRLGAVRLLGVGPFDDLELSLYEAPARAVGEAEAQEEAAELKAPVTRPLTVLFGGDGTGKTSLAAALAQTRPGHALPLLAAPARAPRDGPPPSCIAEWVLGEDDPARPHALRVTGPNVTLEGEAPEDTTVRRREQALFDRRAQSEGGFAFLSFSGARWFSRAPTLLTCPERTLLKHDARAAATFDDPTRADLARETKQIIAYATIARALATPADGPRLAGLETAVREVLDVLLAPFEVAYDGIDAKTLEPRLRYPDGDTILFDAMPRGARHLAAFGALAVRTIAAACPGRTELRDGEIVILIDDLESQQDPSLLRELPSLLSRALPRAQWILTTGSQAIASACAPDQVVALRRADVGGVELHEGPNAVIH